MHFDVLHNCLGNNVTARTKLYHKCRYFIIGDGFIDKEELLLPAHEVEGEDIV